MGESKNINKVALKKALVKGILPDMALPYVLVRPLLNGGARSPAVCSRFTAS